MQAGRSGAAPPPPRTVTLVTASRGGGASGLEDDYLLIADGTAESSAVPPLPTNKPSKFAPGVYQPGNAGAARPSSPPKPKSPLSPISPSIVAVATQSASANEASGRRENGVGFTLWAHNLGLLSGYCNILFGLTAITWVTAVDERPSNDKYLFVYAFIPPYCITLGVVILAFEFAAGLKQVSWLPLEKSRGRSPLRAFFYLALAIPAFLSYPTILAAFPMLVCSAANARAFSLNEVLDPNNIPRSKPIKCQCLQEPTPREEPSGSGEPDTNWKRFLRWWNRMDEIGYLGQLLFITVFSLVNVILFFVRLSSWIEMVGKTQPYAPWAKAFGQILNFDCAMILLPVTKTFVRWLHDIQQRTSSENAIRALRRFTPPLRKNVLFHIFVALFILVATVGHVFFHFINLSQSAEITIRTFGTAPFITGYLITFAMMLIYTAAQERVKRANYEIFWINHHAFIVFMALLLAHAPNFWAWAIFPLALYVGERLYREFKKATPYYVANVTYTEPVMCLTFFPGQPGSFNFHEGQYVYILVPSISKHEWHPFTISSASEDLARKDPQVTLHIRVQKTGSWTQRVCAMFESTAPASAKQGGNFSVSFTHMDSTGNALRGKHKGPDGLPLLLVDGPHAAPAQHYAEYKEVLLVGAGIGLTPSSSILQSILKHKWKKGFPPETIYFCLIVRHDEIFSFRWFIKLLVELEKSVSSDYVSGNLDPKRNRMEIHIFVTNAQENAVQRHPSLQLSIPPVNSGAAQASSAIPAGMNVDIGFGHMELELAMLNPTVKSSQWAHHMNTSTPERAPNRFKHISVWSGRPPWEDIFTYIKLRRSPETKEIAVCFCGTPAIGKDLGALCRKHSSLHDSLRIHLLKENF